MFKCEICGKEYKTITERAACETACAKKMEAENAAKQEAINRKREEELRKQITDSITVTEHLVEDYEAEFGTVPNVGKFYYEVKKSDFDVPTSGGNIRPSLWSWLLNL